MWSEEAPKRLQDWADKFFWIRREDGIEADQNGAPRGLQPFEGKVETDLARQSDSVTGGEFPPRRRRIDPGQL